MSGILLINPKLADATQIERPLWESMSLLCFQIGKRNPSNLCHVRGDWGYAGDHDTVKCRLQVMMALFELRLEKGKPLEACTYLLPKFISKWNIEKGGVDDMSQVLAHVLNWCGWSYQPTTSDVVASDICVVSI